MKSSTIKVLEQIRLLRLKNVFEPIELRYKSDLDKNGVFYYLGTNGTAEEFESPISRGLVYVASSKWHVNSENYVPMSCWQANVGWLVTDNNFGSFICFSLIDDFQFIPRHYRLQNGSQAKTATETKLRHVLRNWRFEGSQDKVNWDILSHHHDDMSLLEQVHASASWPLQATTPYRHFRVITSGRNSSMHFYTHFGSIEMWGTLLRQTTEQNGGYEDTTPAFMPQSAVFNEEFASGLVIS
eukprot:c18571_g1_i4.p1 GENE.c18571_g1_i4~~c18571_g1_i4.p1  ORF type:complete len:241 (+),score=43.48 c18571_g1_i4:362-1084(+)